MPGHPIESSLLYGEYPLDNVGPLEVAFTPNFHRPVATGPGRALQCHTSGSSVHIYDPDSYGSKKPVLFQFHASVGTHKDQPGIGFEVRSKDPFGKSNWVRHPDIYAARLLARSIRYFERYHTGGERIVYLHGNWLAAYKGMPASDNYVQYVGYLASLGAGPYSEEQRFEAAFSTWTGDQAKKNQFTEVDSVDEGVFDGSPHVEAYFRRPVTA